MNIFETSRIVAASPEALYSAFETPARLETWWGPEGFTNSFDTFELTPGGRWRFTMHGPDGKDYANDAVFVELVPARRIVIDHVSAPRFRLAIGLEPMSSGTRVTWTQDFEDAAVAAAIRHIVEPANEQNLNRWTAEVASHA
jgi:uncharacterized protein YndB with AHSA1/START domain